MADIGSSLGASLPMPPPLAARRIDPSPAAPAATVSRRGERHAIVFHGSGSEYFRIWIVNLLLTLVTFGLYYPWAKVRKLRYFHTSTEIGGHALDFHGHPRQMLRGFLLVGLLAIAYGAVAQISPVAEGLAVLVLAALWPALWRAALQFRLANTSWRGLRFRFTGSMGGAYGVLLVPLLALAVFGAGIGVAESLGDGGPLLALLPLALVVALYAVLPYAWLRLKRYQHGHYAYAQHQTELRTTAGAVYGVFLRIAGVALLSFFALMVVIGVAAVAVGMNAAGASGSGRAIARALLGFAPLIVLAVLLVQVLPRAYAVARTQNLLWSRTGNGHLRFESTLAVGPLAKLMLKNWLLVVLTLGLYWPWAAISMARLRLEAVTLRTRDSIDQFVAGTRAPGGDAAGDAAGDVFGIDLGL